MESLLKSKPKSSCLNCQSISCERCHICPIICCIMWQCTCFQINRRARGRALKNMGKVKVMTDLKTLWTRYLSLTNRQMSALATDEKERYLDKTNSSSFSSGIIEADNDPLVDPFECLNICRVWTRVPENVNFTLPYHFFRPSDPHNLLRPRRKPGLHEPQQQCWKQQCRKQQ